MTPISQSSALASPIPGGWTERTVEVAERHYRLRLPADPDRFLDDPGVQARNRSDDWMPYWAWLWPAARCMAGLVARRSWPARVPAIEIGCGIGLVGIAGLDQGLDVLFSDAEPDAVALAVFNARQNGHSSARGTTLDWRRPTERSFPVVLGCDILYDERDHAFLLRTLQMLMSSGGVAWLGDPGRQQAPAFVDEALLQGFGVEFYDANDVRRAKPVAGEFRLIELSWPAGITVC